MRKRKTTNRKLVFCCTILFLALLVICCGLRILELDLYSGNNPKDTHVSKTITRDGVDYFPRQDITVMMVLGIAPRDEVTTGVTYDHTGLCDMAMLLIFDQASEQLRILNLDPDTMMNLPASGNGDAQEYTLAQLALVHSFGSDPEDSCENTRKTVSDYLYGIEIDHYLSLDLEAIKLLNDAIGGVTVTVKDDFSQTSPTIPTGTVTLQGDQAVTFICSRQNAEDQPGASRMKRQQEYARSFLSAFHTKATQDAGFILSAFEDVAPYLVSDCSVISTLR